MSNSVKMCRNCNYASGAVKNVIKDGALKKIEGCLCCHPSEKVKADVLFTGKTSPRWCPLKSKREQCFSIPHIEKSDFIEFSLQPFIKRLDGAVESLTYERKNDEEYCIIQYKNGYKRRVCITADSERAITNDVLKAL